MKSSKGFFFNNPESFHQLTTCTPCYLSSPSLSRFFSANLSIGRIGLYKSLKLRFLLFTCSSNIEIHFISKLHEHWFFPRNKCLYTRFLRYEVALCVFFVAAGSYYNFSYLVSSNYNEMNICPNNITTLNTLQNKNWLPILRTIQTYENTRHIHLRLMTRRCRFGFWWLKEVRSANLKT